MCIWDFYHNLGRYYLYFSRQTFNRWSKVIKCKILERIFLLERIIEMWRHNLKIYFTYKIIPIFFFWLLCFIKIKIWIEANNLEKIYIYNNRNKLMCHQQRCIVPKRYEEYIHNTAISIIQHLDDNASFNPCLPNLFFGYTLIKTIEKTILKYYRNYIFTYY